MSRNSKLVLAALTLAVLCLGSATVSRADTILFQTNFNSTPFGTYDAISNLGNSGFKVTGGNVDAIGRDANGNTLFDFYPGNGVYIDLSGTENGQITTVQTFNFVTGQTYTLSFNLAGGATDANDPDPNNTVGVGLGTAFNTSAVVAGQTTLTSATPFTTFSYTFSVLAPTSAALVFTQMGGSDNRGAYLDNVVLSSASSGAPSTVPEPTTMLLLGTGLAGVGATVRRRRKASTED